MRTRQSAALLLAAMALSACPASGQAKPKAWSPTLLRNAQAWRLRMNDARVAVSSGALRVEIAPGRSWAVAALPSIALPRDAAAIRVHVRSTTGGGRWLAKLRRGAGAPGELTVALIQGRASGGTVTAGIHPGVWATSLELQLGLEGEPGAAVEFDSVAFVREPARYPKPVPGQVSLPVVEAMPRIPQPYKMIDWRAKARAFDRLAFDAEARGPYLPLVRPDTWHGLPGKFAFGLPSYVGGELGPRSGQEAITCIGAVLGGTLVGCDKRTRENDYVAMCRPFYSPASQGMVGNLIDHDPGGSFWYAVWPNIAFYALGDRYPDVPGFDLIRDSTAYRWRQACLALSAGGAAPDFNATGFDFRTMHRLDNGRWREPDGAAGVAWLEYAAYCRTHDPDYLQAAAGCLTFLDGYRGNPYYECLLPWGALAAVRMNAEQGRRFNADRLIRDCFGLSTCRGGWGVTVGRWGSYDCSGLVGSVDDCGGYAFTFNTFTQAAALVPVARYDTRYARALGRWMLNLANNARLFYPGELPAGHESAPDWKGDPAHAIAYEGLRHTWHGVSPYASGDPVLNHWGPKTDLSLYGSAYAGMLGAIVRRTSDDKVLALDCLATDFYHPRAYPTFLLYNPHAAATGVTLPLGSLQGDLYDAVSHRFVARLATARTRVRVPADHAMVAVLVPSGARLAASRGRLTANRVVIDYRLAAPAPARRGAPPRIGRRQP